MAFGAMEKQMEVALDIAGIKVTKEQIILITSIFKKSDIDIVPGEIEKQLPIPKAKNHKKYFFDDMDVGDSIFVEAPTIGEKFRVRSNLSGSAKQRIRINSTMKKWKFTTRTVEDGVRIWRVK